jgi:hypothetical protein
VSLQTTTIGRVQSRYDEQKTFLVLPRQAYEMLSIPRSREVGQSYFTSVFTTLYAAFYAFVVVFKTGATVVSMACQVLCLAC